MIPPERELNYGLRRANTFDQPIERMNRSSNTYFQNCSKEWNRLHISVQSGKTISEFKKRLIQIMRPVRRSIFNVHYLYGVKLLTRLRVEFSDFRSHRYNHNFHCSEPSCSCQTGEENNEHFLLRCPRFSTQRKIFLDLVSNLVGTDKMRLSSIELCTLLLYGNDFSFLVTRGVIEEIIKYIKNTKRFGVLTDNVCNIILICTYALLLMLYVVTL